MKKLYLSTCASSNRPTFEARMAIGNKRRLDQMSLLGCQAKLAELVDVRTGRVADPHNGVLQICRGQIGHAFAALAEHLEAVIAARNLQPTSEGLNSSTVCQPSVMTLCLPCQCEDTSTIGPGSRYRRTWLTGKSSFVGCFTSASECSG